jgi:TolB-like protein/class 3 adenylate cyclase/Tfp pilus assembly protein PilF
MSEPEESVRPGSNGHPDLKRRLTAVAFADLVGYSRLMAENDERNLHRWRTLRSELIEPRIAEHGGHLLRTFGDGLFVTFESAVDAVRWANSVQRALIQPHPATNSDLLIRIGINVEDVIVDGDELHGDGVNIAARVQDLANPGEVLVTAAVRDYVWNKLDIELADLGEYELKNISRRVRVFRVGPKMATGHVRRPRPYLAWRNRPSLAVLPFRNLGGDPRDDYFGEGMTEDIITALSRTRSLFVIARNSTLRYREGQPDLHQVSRDLDVQYVLQGSVRRQVATLRISTKLIDVRDDRTLWADNFTGANDDLFGFQDQIAAKIVGRIEPHLLQAESERVRTKPPATLTAYDFVLQALPLLHTFQGDDLAQAAALLDKALQEDSCYAQAYAYKAWVHLLLIAEGRSLDLRRDAAQASLHVENALKHDHDDPFVLAVAGHVNSLLLKDPVHAAELFDRALELNENSAFAWGMSGLTYCYLGQCDEALERFGRAQRLSPFDPLNFFYLAGAGMAEFLAGRDDLAIQWLQKALRQRRRFFAAWRHLTTCFAHAGRLDEARAAAKELLALEPGFRVSTFAGWYPLTPADNLHKYVAGLRAAGLPE